MVLTCGIGIPFFQCFPSTESLHLMSIFTAEKFNEFIEHLLHRTMEHSLFSNMYNFFRRSDQGISHNAYCFSRRCAFKVHLYIKNFRTALSFCNAL